MNQYYTMGGPVTNSWLRDVGWLIFTEEITFNMIFSDNDQTSEAGQAARDQNWRILALIGGAKPIIACGGKDITGVCFADEWLSSGWTWVNDECAFREGADGRWRKSFDLSTLKKFDHCQR